MPDVLIGNIRGPQGEAGPANKLLATVYEFCESDSGTRIPAGPWITDLTEIEKGKYYWCRNTCTWEQGPETILYSVGYVGNDGEFNGIELVDALGQRVTALEDRTVPISKGGTESTTLAGAQAKLGITALEDKIKAINDYTTGINLIRGSRDFKTGTELYGGITYRDGFKISIDSKVHRFIDDSGFTVVNFSQTGTTANYNLLAFSSPVFGIQKGETYTVSFDFKVDDLSVWTNRNFCAIDVVGKNGNYKQTVNATVPTNIKSKEWITVVQKISITADIEDGDYLFVTLRLSRDGSLYFKKLVVQNGSIEHPIWSPSPFDIDRINDETTGINLLRGTRDFQAGNKKYYNYYSDGFTGIKSGDVTIDADGFSVLGFSANNSIVWPVIIDNFTEGETITIAGKVKFKSDTPVNYTNVLSIYNAFPSAGPQKLKDVPLNDIGIDLTEIKTDKWYDFKYFYTMTKPVNGSESAILIECRGYGTGANNGLLYKMLNVQRGRINNPVWSASPFDVASNSLQNAWDSANADGRIGLYSRVLNAGDKTSIRITPSTGRQAFLLFGPSNNDAPFVLGLTIRTSNQLVNLATIANPMGWTFTAKYDSDSKSCIISVNVVPWTHYVIISGFEFTGEVLP